ncbi:histidine kinase/DNA gyrase B/HSP90-like ATPase [Tahibacter aquaticus]|uniref:histidine kinase n=1 Tax=Tahibacter aquaticus TaxID=520092 RepID=A0A4R6YQD4_9GAMM|nr:ATP-binding protein [Tahibacter aquaticus]TDR40038.1 histidine kinase/DNA gyrase B/HSP90-like ATPase [Tahibacter aquaticus]
MNQQNRGFLHKYRSIVVAIVLFVSLDIALIAYNLAASYTIDRYTASRDLSGSMRSSTQIVLRSLLEMQADVAAGGTIGEEARTTLRDRAALIQNGLSALREGGSLPGDAEATVYAAATQPAQRAEADKFASLWQPYQQLLQPLLAADVIDAASVGAAASHGRRINSELFGAINRFVNATQDLVTRETRVLRIVQIVGILFALLNFLYTALLASRRLLEGDRAVARSQKQTGDILATVKEGLFLVTPEQQIGEQMSASLKDVLRQEVKPGQKLFDLLTPMVSAPIMEAARDYVGLLFGKRVKENLVYSLNPLSEVEIGGDTAQKRYLSFQFNRVLDEGEVSGLLVTVQDATERVNLQAEVASAKSRAREQMEVLLRVLNNDPAEVQDFLRRTESSLEQVNATLRQAARRSGENYLGLVNSVFRHVHGIKSEAAAMNLEMFESVAHAFELDLVALRDRGDVEGADMVKLALHLDDLFECLNSVRGLFERLGTASPAPASAPAGGESSPAQQLLASLRGLAKRIAADLGKEVRVTGDMPAFDTLPQGMADDLRSISLQLLRNAVVHGIEEPQERRQHGKAAGGIVHFSCRRSDTDGIDFSVRDDGRGISPRRVREALVRSQRYTADEVAAMPDRDVVMKIFEPGISTASESNRDAGHGAGMDVVLSRVNAMGARIALGSQGHSHTEFRIRIALPSAAAAA